MANITSKRLLIPLLAVLAMGAAASSASAQSREFMRGYEQGFRDGVASVQGGAGHKGDDLWGGTVYDTVDDPHFVVLYQWATSVAP